MGNAGRRRLSRLLGASALAAAALGLTGCEPQGFDLAFFGDVPYSSSDISEYNEMIADINDRDIALSFHVGDIGPGSSSTCTNATVDRETARFDTLEKALVYTPGDNEWRDCSDELGRLAYIRQKVFRSDGKRSRGTSPIALTSQVGAGYPENARFSRGPITLASLHIVGGKDNYGEDEFDRRRAANINWLRAAFTQAKNRGHKGVILFTQADPNLDQSQTGESREAFESMYNAIRAQVAAFNGQVLFINGDGHDYRNLRPIPALPNLRQIQVEGDSKVSYIRVHVDPGGNPLFTISEPRSF